MEMLKKEELGNRITDAEIKPSSEILSEEQIILIKKSIDLKPSEKFGKGMCLPNAFQVARIIGSDIIEGVVHVLVERDKNESETIIKHAWNCLNGVHFDVTKDLVWPNSSVKLLRSKYSSVGMLAPSDYDLNEGQIEFKSDVDLISTSIKYLFTKRNVEIALRSMGLDEKFHEQLLNDCATTIKQSSFTKNNDV